MISIQATIIYLGPSFKIHHMLPKTDNQCPFFCTVTVKERTDPIREVTVHRARLILRWVTACGQVNHLGM